MSRKKGRGNRVRDATGAGLSTGYLVSPAAWSTLCGSGYTRLSDNPEVIMAVNKIATLIGSMTIHLMTNSDAGDVRIRNELSRKVDITPNRYMTRKSLLEWIVHTLLVEGAGNAVVIPRTRDGYLEELVPVPPGQVSFVPQEGGGYAVELRGARYDPEGLLHFVLYPDVERPWMGTGYRVALRDVVGNLKQAAKTKSGYLESRWQPPVIVKIQSSAEEMATKEGRDKLASQYLTSSGAGEPWIIPAELMDVQSVKPLTLQDLAINDTVTLDKKTVAAVLGVPPWVVGAGEFKQDEWNAFITTTVLPLVRGLEQELTRKLLISERMFFRMNPWSLYSYDIKTLADIGSSLYVRGMMTGNEVRDWIGQGPLPGLDELVILENYIPLGAIGEQNKIGGGKPKQEGGEST